MSSVQRRYLGLVAVAATGLSHASRSGIWRRRRKVAQAIECLESRRLLSAMYFVDANAPGPTHDGSSWSAAFVDLQQALSAATAGDQIHVADGTYTPTSGTDRTASFQLESGVAIYGGYAGIGAADPDARDVLAHPTILSGDIGTVGDSSDNSYSVVTDSYVDATAILDGLIMTAGNGDRGGGMYSNSGSPTLRNCTFSGNSASEYGGGVYNGGGFPTFNHCMFIANVAGPDGPAGYPNQDQEGGGVFNFVSAPTFVDCTFSGNTANKGGGMANYEYSSSILVRCTFTQNTASRNTTANQLGLGGAIYNYDHSSPSLSDCTLSGNAAESGGGVYNGLLSAPPLTGCTFGGNTASSPMAGGGIYDNSSSPTVTNCTFIQNAATSGIGTGGGIYNFSTCAPILSGCAFIRNTARGGAGMTNYGSGCRPQLLNCSFNGNAAAAVGGGIDDVVAASASVINCAFIGNTAGTSGGGMYHASVNSAALINCTFARNSAGSFGGGVYISSSSPLTVGNAILWDNTAPGGSQIYDSNNTAVVTYSVVEDGFAGTGNVNADPEFVRDPSPGADGVWGTADDYGDLQLQMTSPCIDAGDNAAVPAGVTTDIAGRTRFFDFPGVADPGAIVDMGANELNMTLGLLRVPDGQTLALPAGEHVFTVEQLALGAESRLDVGDDTLLLPYTAGTSPIGSWNGSAYTGITGLIASGRNGGAWDGSGIVTSMSAAVAPNSLTTLGVAEASSVLGLSGTETALWNGVTVNATTVIVKYGYASDANLDGIISGDDYFQIDSGFPAGAHGWINGDFNYDGIVNGDDYLLIDSNFPAQSPVL